MNGDIGNAFANGAEWYRDNVMPIETEELQKQVSRLTNRVNALKDKIYQESR